VEAYQGSLDFQVNPPNVKELRENTFHETGFGEVFANIILVLMKLCMVVYNHK